MQRPLGVTVLAVLALPGGGLNVLGVAAAYRLGDMEPREIIAGLFALAGAVLMISFAIGAWRLKSWAWTVGMVTLGMALLRDMVGLALGASPGSVFISFVITGLLIWYFFRPQVRQAFGK